MIAHRVALTALVTLALGTQVHAAPKGPEGIWLGTLDAGKVKLRVAFHVAKKPDGSFSATFDSLDQGAKGLPVEKASYVAPTLRLEMTRVGAIFEGKLDGDKLSGTFTQGQPMPLALARVEKIEGPKRPQEPKRPYPYKEEEVAIQVAETPLAATRATKAITLGGTLTIPTGKGPFPAVVFITGSGPEDRDETVFDHKPFLILADALTRRGIATLRLDDRGVGKSGGGTSGDTTFVFAKDVEAELEWLAQRPEIDKRAIGVIGHSEGGVIGPIAATTSPRARFVVMLAGTGMTGEQILYAQTALMMRAGGAPEAAIKQERVDNEKLYKAMNAAKTDAELDAAVQAYIDADPKQKTQRQGAKKTLSSPWLRTFLTLDPLPYLEKLKVPVLSIAGDKDMQVPKENSPLILAALQRGKNPDATVKLLPGLNHLFQHCKTGAPGEYHAIEETFSPEAVQLVGDWITERAVKLRK